MSIVNVFADDSLSKLLQRSPFQLDLTSATEQIRGRVVAVTGAAGSIGSELCRQILKCGVDTLLCVDQNETGVFYLQQKLSKTELDQQLIFSVVDVKDGDEIQHLFSKYVPDVVFHAAAYKHVPLMEQNIRSVIKNNVFGLLNVVDAVRKNGCRNFIFISSDKAVNPTSIMGTTKRIGELIVAAEPQGDIRCISVRFGNVLFSSGSVLDTFQQQLDSGQPLTVTHAEASRFFMTPHEASSLLMQAFAEGKHGDILILETGEPIRIIDLARSFAEVASACQIPIKLIGLRPGEKLVEDLFYREEEIFPTSFPQIKRTRNTIENCDYLYRLLEELRAAMYEHNPKYIHAVINKMVPQCCLGFSADQILETSDVLA